MEKFCSVTILQYCLEAECLCIDLAERENGEIFHMFISRTARDKQPSPSLSVLPLKAQSEQVIKILLSQGELPLLLQKHRVEKTATMLCRSLSSSWLPLFIHEICTRCSYISSPPIHHVPSDGVIKTRLKIFHQNATGPATRDVLSATGLYLNTRSIYDTEYVRLHFTFDEGEESI